MPTYETTESYSPIPVFRSSLVFNGVSYSGDKCKSKKEAEQSVARANTQIVVNDANVDEETKIPNTGSLPTTTTPPTPQMPSQTIALLAGTNNVATNQSTCAPMNPPVHLPQTHVPRISTNKFNFNKSLLVIPFPSKELDNIIGSLRTFRSKSGSLSKT
ncbi:hypothetical protein LXL04_003271 [Taraxacum kok-saghyz]